MIAVKLKEFLSGISVSIRAIGALADRNSEIMGRVLAKELGVEFGFYESSGANESYLVVAADSRSLRQYMELWREDISQIVFAANHNWLSAAPVAPDIIGLMSQYYSFPWDGEGLRVTNSEDGKVESIPPDDRMAEEIAMEIFNIGNGGEGLGRHLDFYLEHRDHIKGIGKLAGKRRHNFVIESPVPGSYFGS
jgi:hypothetical protein